MHPPPPPLPYPTLHNHESLRIESEFPSDTFITAPTMSLLSVLPPSIPPSSSTNKIEESGVYYSMQVYNPSAHSHLVKQVAEECGVKIPEIYINRETDK